MGQLLYYRTKSDKPAAEFITKQLNKHQKNGRILWLVSGGSTVAVAAAVFEKLAGSRPNLTVALADERYGPPGHKDSNFKQLKDAGCGQSKAAIMPVLDGSSLARTAANYNKTLKRLFSECDFKIALLGVGADGHIAGIKPGSPAIESSAMVCGYEWADFQRLTITPAAIAQLDMAVVYMAGEAKHATIMALKGKSLPPNEQPAQALKTVKRVIIFNDLVGDTPA